jgi:hypothetical protein
LYFSCQNKKELAQATITTVVVQITTDLTKLDSHFSEFSAIFYTIYKNQQFTLTIEVYLLRKGPWKETKSCNVTPMAVGRRGLANSGELACALARGRGGEGLGD